MCQQGKGAEKGSKANLQQQALHDIFVGSPHMFLAESNNTLYLSLDHPEVLFHSTNFKLTIVHNLY